MSARLSTALVVICGLWMAPASAHHAVQAQFDVTKPVTLKGLITKVEWSNPHVHLYLDVDEGRGVVSKWEVESLGTGMLLRGGVTKERLSVGEAVTVIAYHAREGLNLAFLRTIKFADGHEVQVWMGNPKK